MKSELRENMYVRLQNDVENIVIINKIANVFEATILTENDGSIYQGEYTKENVIKASYSIIDILEVGDYVNGYPIYEIVEYEDDTRAIVIGDDNKSIIWKKQDIEDVITKEQFEQMKYRIGE